MVLDCLPSFACPALWSLVTRACWLLPASPAHAFHLAAPHCTALQQQGSGRGESRQAQGHICCQVVLQQPSCRSYAFACLSIITPTGSFLINSTNLAYILSSLQFSGWRCAGGNGGQGSDAHGQVQGDRGGLRAGACCLTPCPTCPAACKRTCPYLQHVAVPAQGAFEDNRHVISQQLLGL